MEKILRINLLLFAAMTIVSCMKNPLDYPYFPAGVTELEVSDQKSVSIDNANRVVTITLNEYADVSNITVKKYAFTENSVPSCELPDVLDLSEPYKISYKTHPDQNYEWTIQAVQPIERYVTCDNMIGTPEIDVEKRTILALFPETQQLSRIRFSKMKLEPMGSVIDSTFGYISSEGEPIAEDRKVQFPIILDCVISRTFKVLHKEDSTYWTFTAQHKVIELEVSSVNAWCYRAEINATFKGTGSPKIEYRESSAQDWVRLETNIDGINATATATNLTSGTEYIARVLNGDSVSEEFKFTTETPDQLPNMSFDEWHQGDPGGYTWYPMPPDVEQIWTTSNTGVNMMSATNSTRPEDDFVAVQGGRAVRLESVKVFGMFAAGNIFTGEFLKATITGGVGAELNWGTPFTSRPYSLKGYYSYSPKVIDQYTDKYNDKKGQMDKAQILVMLTDWDAPFLVATAKEQFVDQENDPHIIAVGSIETDVDTNGEYVEFECVLDYRDTTRKPKYIVAVACSSLYGDYFTGGLGSVMYVDDWELIYK